MAKSKQEKKDELDYLSSHLAQAKSTVFVGFKGLKVKESEELRKALFEAGVALRVVKASLLKRVLREWSLELDSETLQKPLALAFGLDDEVTAAKEIDQFRKKYNVLEILGGILEQRLIDSASVLNLAAVPSRQDLNARFTRAMAAPISGLVNVLAGNLRGLINVLSAYKDSK